ncbi:hypothetical protein DACRYDRAFT_116371 [Dacryopinax primogenitus]|uniref:Uncharacterized protein n=1 Tax=Dacryopinax primogenitus (strain DJM 731) TaxID=1858805 RepID=M5G1A6_DACPD|nr:uncharacterized protein DACRYDRAFT_116371 [Dacryopinax primogenitus]EJU01970.1 hypothetical protein DACRYDRAFT_116371 [Dacryopinax primogenitus]
MSASGEYSELGKHPIHISVAGPLLPLIIQQGPHPSADPAEIHWLAKSQRAPAYLDLLYDLAIAAVLSVFGDKHQIMNASSVLAYFSHFIIIWWVWASQCLYDARYQSNDWFHRLFKLLQLAVFTYVGVFVQDFDPGYVVRPEDVTVLSAVAAVGGSRSYRGVALAYAVSRLLLAFQHVYVLCATQPRARRSQLLSFLIPLCTCLFSAPFWLIAGLLKSNATAKLVLGYLGLGIEVIISLGVGHLRKGIAPASGLLAERFADLTLVILAEGVLGIVKTLADVVSGFGLTAGGSTLTAYSECLCCLVIVFGIWHFIFHAFNPEDRFKSRRFAGAWAFLHLPLHFVILIVLSSMKNVVVYENVGGAMYFLVPMFNQALNNTGETNNYALFDALLPPEDILQFNKLSLQPSFMHEINHLNSEVLILSDSTTDLPENDPYIEALQYAAQICMEVASSYDIQFTELTTEAYANLSDVSRAWNTNETQLSDQENYMDEWWNYFFYVYFNDLMTPSLYFMPCAGALVILAEILTVFRTQGSEEEAPTPDQIYGSDDVKSAEDYPMKLFHSASFDSAFSAVDRVKKFFGIPIYILEWAPLVLHLLVGIGLVISAILDRAPSPDDPNLAFEVLEAGWTLPIVALAYGSLIVTDIGILVLIRVALGGTVLQSLAGHRKNILDSTVVTESPAAQQTEFAPPKRRSFLPALRPTSKLDIPQLSAEGPKTPLLSPSGQESHKEDDEERGRPASPRSLAESAHGPLVRSGADEFRLLYDGVVPSPDR